MRLALALLCFIAILQPEGMMVFTLSALYMAPAVVSYLILRKRLTLLRVLLAYLLAAAINLVLFGACLVAFSQFGNPPWASGVFGASVFGGLAGPLIGMFLGYKDRKIPRKSIFVKRVH
jgi:hypothetical protein